MSDFKYGDVFQGGESILGYVWHRIECRCPACGHELRCQVLGDQNRRVFEAVPCHDCGAHLRVEIVRGAENQIESVAVSVRDR